MTRARLLRWLRPGGEDAVLRAARRRDPEAWSALRSGIGEGATEKRCLLTVDVPGTRIAPCVADVAVSEVAGPVQPRGYDGLRGRYTCQTRRVERVRDLAPEDASAVVHLHADRRRRLRFSVIPVGGSTGTGFVCALGPDDVEMIEGWLRSRGARESGQAAPDDARG